MVRKRLVRLQKKDVSAVPMFARDKHGGGRKLGTFWLDSVIMLVLPAIRVQPATEPEEQLKKCKGN